MERRDFLIFTAAALLAGCASQGDKSAAGGGDSSGMKFSASDRAAVEAYYGKPSGTLPPQSAKVGDVLPPGQRPAKLPGKLLSKLPDLPAPYTRYVVGNDIVLVNRDTHVVLDVMPQVVR